MDFCHATTPYNFQDLDEKGLVALLHVGKNIKQADSLDFGTFHLLYTQAFEFACATIKWELQASLKRTVKVLMKLLK